MNQILSVCQCYDRDEISHVSLVSSENNLVDGWPKERPNDAVGKLLDTVQCLKTMPKWIVWTRASSTSRKYPCENDYQYNLKMLHHTNGSSGESTTCLSLGIYLSGL